MAGAFSNTSPRTIKLATLVMRYLQLHLAAFIIGVASYHTWEFATGRLSLTGGSSGKLPKALYAILVIGSTSYVAALYTFLSIFVTYFGNKKIFLITLIMDFLLLGGFIAVSILMRGSEGMRCHSTEYSSSIASSSNNFPSNIYGSGGRARRRPEVLCWLDKFALAIAEVLSVCFGVTIFFSYLALRTYRKDRAFGPSPANGYSASNNPSPRSWDRNPFNRASGETAYTNNTEVDGTTAGGTASYGSRHKHQPVALGGGYNSVRNTPALSAPEEPVSRVSADNGRVAPHQMF